MNKLVLFFVCLISSLGAMEQIAFNPPKGWKLVDSKILSPRVKVMVVGEGRNSFYPPSINLGYEEYKGSLSDYLKEIQTINRQTGAVWTNLGTLQTAAGPASLSQVDLETEWGSVRMMHVILIRNQILYVLTAASLKNEFPAQLSVMQESMRSLHFIE